MIMEPFAKTAALVQQGLEQGAYPSACLSVGIGPRVLCRRTFGHVTGHTLYDMASVSKILGATMIALRWLEEGKLRPDLIIGVPVGLLTAVFLSKIAPKGLGAAVSTAVELLAGIPSVVYGLLGMTLLVPAVAKTFGIASGACLFSAILVLALMILPNIVSVSVTALNAVPPEYEEASLALGATPIETYFKVSVPAARSGIAAGVVLGIGRAIGEAMAVIMVAGNVANMPGLFKSVTFLTTAIAKEMSYAGGLQREALFSIALVLFIFIMIINGLLNFFLKGGDKDDK